MEIINNVKDLIDTYGLKITTIFFAIIGLISFIKFLVENYLRIILLQKSK